MTYSVEERKGWSYIVGAPLPCSEDHGPWRYRWEAQEYADELNAALEKQSNAEQQETEMAEKKYSVGEINRMRQSLTFLCDTGFAFMKTERDAEIEQKLRTYMLNGTDPEELEKEVSERLAFQQQARR